MKLRLMASFLLVAMMFALTTSAQAQTYYFSLDEEIVNVYWNEDGTIAVDYIFAFSNSPSADPIDFVDVGMPNASFDWNSISADVDGTPVGISSDFYGEGGYGFAVDLGSLAIQPGQSGQVHVNVGRISNMLYPDDDEPDTYVSGEYSPTWFGSQYVSGSTHVMVTFHLPAGVQPEEARYHPARGGWPCASEPQAAYDQTDRITYTWDCPTADGHSQYTFGLSFPGVYVPPDAVVTTPPAPAFDLGSTIGGIVAWFFSSFSTFAFCGCFGLIFVGGPIWAAINERRRKLQYLPPKISIEGHGIKRGLTAVEAAILMEQPLDKVMTMILFGVVKKNAAEVVKRDPLALKLSDPLPADLHEYEKDFLTAFTKPVLGDQRKNLQEMTVELVKVVGDKMKGFSRSETTTYYKSIMERAWAQIEAAGTPEVKGQLYEEALEWTMLDKQYDERTRRVFTGPVLMPMWWGNYDPSYRPVSAGRGIAPKISVPGASISGGRVSVPGAAFAASVVGNVQAFSSRILGDVGTFTSGITNRTNPLPKTSSGGGFKHGGGGGGGRSCACACACAGCACACAGGGR